MLTVALMSLLAFAIPFNLSSNLQNYSGAKRIAAQDALEMAYFKLNPLPPVPFKFLKATVEDVIWKCDKTAIDMLPEHSSSSCEIRDSNPKCSGAYLIKVGYRTIFGIKTQDVIFNGANLDPNCI